MPTPDGLTTTTIHGKFVEPNGSGTPLKGTLDFTPNPAFVIFPDENIIVAGTETATLDDNGEFTIELISTDQTGENPTGWTYSVTQKIVNQKQTSYLIALPYNGGEVVELSDITPTTDAPTYIPVVGPQGPPGIVTTVNGHSAATINLVAADLPDLIPMSQRAAANGVATLDSTTKIPSAQLPDLSGTYILTSRIGAASGVAGLDGSSKVLSTNLNLAGTAPAAIATNGAAGTSTNLARQDHTHAGVDLTSAQTIAGVKTFSSGTQLTQLGVGVAAGTQRAHIVSTVDEVSLQVEQVTLTGANALASFIGFDNSMVGVGVRVNGDTVSRVALKTSGNIEFGPGNAARDTTLYRSSNGNLNSNQFNADAAAPTATSHLTRKDYVDGNFVTLTTSQTISGAKTFTAVQTLQGATSTVLQQHKVSGDTNNRFQITTDGALSFGPGNAAVDVTISRTAASVLNLNAQWQSTRAAAANLAFASLVSGDANNRFTVAADGKFNWGPATTAPDTNFYRSGVGALTTDGNLTVAGLTIAGKAQGRGLVASVIRTSTITGIVSGSNTVALTTSSATYVNGRAYRITVLGRIRTDTTGAWGLAKVVKGSTTAGTTYIDTVRISIPTSNTDTLISTTYLMVNTSGADIITQMSFLISVSAGNGQWTSDTAAFATYMTVEDVGLSSDWVGNPMS